MKNIIVLVVILFSFGHEQKTAADSVLQKHKIYIGNKLPNQSKALIVHCKSKDTDFGIHTLNSGQAFLWRFRSNIFGSTEYWCNFWWGVKNQGYTVFSGDWAVTFHTYNYLVKPDGIYVGHDQDDDREFNVTLRAKWN